MFDLPGTDQIGRIYRGRAGCLYSFQPCESFQRIQHTYSCSWADSWASPSDQILPSRLACLRIPAAPVPWASARPRSFPSAFLPSWTSSLKSVYGCDCVWELEASQCRSEQDSRRYSWSRGRHVRGVRRGFESRTSWVSMRVCVVAVGSIPADWIWMYGFFTPQEGGCDVR